MHSKLRSDVYGSSDVPEVVDDTSPQPELIDATALQLEDVNRTSPEPAVTDITPGESEVAIVGDNYRKDTAVWFTSQRSRVQQRDDHYVKESFAHPGKMLPDLARSILDTYGRPGDVWCDPMCGIGTLLVEGMHRGYTVHGIEWEERWSRVAQLNLDFAAENNASGTAIVKQGDARVLTTLFPGVLYNKIAFSPPYGNSLSKTTHGRDLHPEKQKGGKRAAKAIRHGYTFEGTEEAAIPDQPGDMTVRANADLVNIGDLRYGSLPDAVRVAENLRNGRTPTEDVGPTYLTEMARVYHQCYQALQTDGMLILVLRDFRRNNRRLDLLGHTLELCEAVGFTYHDRSVALQCPVDGVGLNVGCRPKGTISFWTLENAKKADPALMVPVFEDILVLRKVERRSRRRR